MHIAKYGEESWYKKKDPTYFEITKQEITQSLTIGGDDYLNAVDNLIRVRLLTSYVDDSSVETQVDGSQESYEVSIYHGYDSVCITSLGETFVRTCTPSYKEEDEKTLIERLRRKDNMITLRGSQRWKLHSQKSKPTSEKAQRLRQIGTKASLRYSHIFRVPQRWSPTTCFNPAPSWSVLYAVLESCYLRIPMEALR